MDEPGLNTTATALPPPQSPSSSDQSSSATSPGNIVRMPSLDPEMDEFTESENPEAALCSLKQKTNSVTEYYYNFQRISRHIEESLPPKFLLKVFVNGLNEKIRSLVMLARPKSIISAFFVARSFEHQTEYRKPIKPRLLGVDGFLGRKKLRVVICDVSDLSFIQPYVVSQLGEDRCNVREEVMTIQGGERVRLKNCANLGLRLGSHEFKEDFYVRGMLGCDIILGRSWLTRLEEATVLKNGEMEYVFDDGVSYQLQWKVVFNAADIIGTLISVISDCDW